MRFFYTLIASGLLILTEIPAEQPPPPGAYQDVPYSISYLMGTKAPVDDFTKFDLTHEVLLDEPEDWYLASSPVTFLGAPENLLPTQFKQANYEARLPPAVERDRLQDGPELLPVNIKASPTTMIKTTTADAALATYRQPSSLPISGYAMFYNPNVMQEVLSNRLAMGHVSPCDECVGNVALLRAGDLNRRVWLQWSDGTVEGPFLVADVAATQHVAQLLARNWVVDVDNRTAVRRGMAGPVLVTVWGSPPPTSQEGAFPFAPLYPTLPAHTPVPTVTPLPALSSSTPLATSAAIQAGFPTETPLPTVTPLPIISATPLTSTVVLGGFPTETPVPTITPLPVIDATPTATFASAPTIAPTQTIAPTPIIVPTNTPLPTSSQVVSTVVVTQGGFPTATPVPTITPLPVINATPTSTQIATNVAPITPNSSLTSTITPTLVVTLGGFPTDTPVPTITPLPAINLLPTPTPVDVTN